jgi:hypothetical protein
MYAPQHRPGLKIDLLMEEELVLVTTNPEAPPLARIMHEVRRFCAFGEQARADDPTGWIVCETTHCATRLG